MSFCICCGIVYALNRDALLLGVRLRAQCTYAVNAVTLHGAPGGGSVSAAVALAGADARAFDLMNAIPRLIFTPVNLVFNVVLVVSRRRRCPRCRCRVAGRLLQGLHAAAPAERAATLVALCSVLVACAAGTWRS